MRRKSLLVLIPFLIPFLIILMASPSFAGFAPDCKSLEVGFSAIKEKPGLYIGSFTGDLTGAVSLFTMKESFLRDGTIVSLIQLTFVTPSADASFSALLDVRDTPTFGGFERVARGELTEGKGEFEGITGKVSLTGGMTQDRGKLKAKGGILLCLP